jgi:hypothetical protein
MAKEEKAPNRGLSPFDRRYLLDQLKQCVIIGFPNVGQVPLHGCGELNSVCILMVESKP